MALTDKQKRAAELYMQSTPITDIAKVVGVSRPTIYDWLKLPDMKAFLDTLTTDAKNYAERKLNGKLDIYVSELEKIALASKSEKVKTDTLIYLINRILGTPTSKTQDVGKDEEKESLTNDQIEDEFSKFKDTKQIKAV